MRSSAAVACGAFVVLLAVAVVRPASAPAGQSFPPAAVTSQIATGVFHSCAVVAGARVRCWGFSGDGQVGYANTRTIGDDETPASAGPVDLGAGHTVKALTAGDFHTCAVLDDGSVRCWGFAFDGELGYGLRNQVGDDETPGSLAAVDLGAGRTATAISAGGRHTCAVLDDGNVRCWGLSDFGQLGYGNTTSIGDSETPASVGPVNLGGHTAKAITAGGHHTCAILDDDTVRCWGSGGDGQLGYGDTTAIQDPGLSGPVNLGAGRTAKAITAGDNHTCAILDNGSVRCWGLGDSGQLGYGNTNAIGDNPGETPGTVGPVDLGGHTATAISAGGDHTCAVLDDGTVRCWGSGVFGELGYANLNSVGDNESPAAAGSVDIGTGRTATAISAGLMHTCARLDDASVRCWGDGADGRLGHCDVLSVGDNETPGSVASVDIGAGGATCPAAAPAATSATATATTTITTTTPAPAASATAVSGDAEALRLEKKRATGLSDCRAAVLKASRGARSRALRYPRGSRLRSVALRKAAASAAQGRVRCLGRFARTPGRVTKLTATGAARGKIRLKFLAPGSSGSNPPAARSYLVKQSLRPIRSARDFERAQPLCKGACVFDVTKVRASITLQITQLRRKTRYYYEVAARDNVSHRTGPRSSPVSAKAG